MRGFLLIFILALIPFGVKAQHNINVHYAGNTIYKSEITKVDSIKLTNQFVNIKESSIVSTFEIQKSFIDSISFDTNPINEREIFVIYNGLENATIINPYNDKGVVISVNGGIVSATSTAGITNLVYNLIGTSSNGSFSLNTDLSSKLVFNNLNLTNPNGAAVSISGKKTTTIDVKQNSKNTLIDGTSGSNSGVVTSNGALIFENTGNLTIKGYKKHGINSSSLITVNNGNIVVETAVSDGLHSEGFTMINGNLKVNSLSDGIDAGDGKITISNGNIDIVSTSDDVKAIKNGAADVDISGGTIVLTISGAASKGIKSNQNINISDANITASISSKVILEAIGSGYDPSYGTVLKSDKNITINSGTYDFTLTSASQGGKGISADGEIIINGGTINIKTAATGAVYVNESGIKDSYASTAITADTNIYLNGGNITTTSSGNGGKGISADGNITIGELNKDNSLLNLNITTSGERFLVSGSGNNADYANPKAVKADGNLTVNSGTITIKGTQNADGGEGLESKAILTINDGIINIETYDDAINAATAIIINGGNTWVKARGNDGIDSNGTLTINGGFTVSNGARSPEEGFDCDNNTFKITGGTIIGTGGATSNPTTNVSTQRSIKITTTFTNNTSTIINLKSSTGTRILTYRIPAFSSNGNGNSVTILITDPLIINGSYTISKGASVSGGTESPSGYIVGGTVTEGSTTKSFTVSTMLTTVSL